ncbi:MAG TPA: ABC transporter permease subunit [Clostridia bacterium]|nr:ABC transporter permease subunit [Clostridia bacterium]
MCALIINTFREKIRNKTFYIVLIIGMVLMLLLTTNNSNLTINGRKVAGFEQMVPVALAIIGFIACLLAIMVSIQTIPNEFERKTTHLVLVRGIKPWQYMFALTSGNIAAGLFCILLLSFSLILFCAFYGKLYLIPSVFICSLLLGINSAFLCAAVSVLTIKLPAFIAGTGGVLIYAAGILHGILDALAATSEGFGATIVKTLLFFIPDFAAIQGQASAVLAGGPFDIQPVASGLLLIYLFLSLTFITFRKEV